MKKITLITAIAMIAFTTNSFAQATAEGTSTATVVAPIGISATAPLAFGNLAVAGLGTVKMTSGGVRSSTGGVTLNTTDAGTVSPAGFSVTGEGAYAYSVTVPEDGVVVLDDGVDAGDAMPVTLFESSHVDGGLLATGADTFTVGATLNVNAGQLAAAYTGTFDVTVAYD